MTPVKDTQLFRPGSWEASGPAMELLSFRSLRIKDWPITWGDLIVGIGVFGAEWLVVWR